MVDLWNKTILVNIHKNLPVAALAGVVSVEGDGGLQVLEGADLGTQAQVRRGEHGLRPRARDVGHRGGHVWIERSL